jgi:uncharacterized protein (DUF1800 family)
MFDCRGLGRAGVAAGLCAVMVGQPVWAQAAGGRTGGSVRRDNIRRDNEVQGQARVLHALNRMTFGPRPGEISAVETMGLNRWFEMQLTPAAIDDSGLEARMAQYPAMGLTIAQLEARYPGPGEIRQIEAGKMELPSDPTLRTMVADQVAFYKMKKTQQAGKTATAASPEGAGNGAATGANAIQTAIAGGEKPMVAAADGEDAAAAAADDSAMGPGFPKELTRKILAMAPDQRFQAVMVLNPDELVQFRQSLKGGEAVQLAAGLAPWQRETLEALPGSLRMVALEETESRVMRDVYSERQLEAVMTDFWLNHFNVYVRKNQQEPYLIPTYERVVRAHALGNFEELLVATAESPAMLEYLDNARSIGADSQAAQRVKKVQEMRPDAKLPKGASAGLNENYGRELMELHTLGVNGGYTQADVTQVAKVFTGWTIDKDSKEFGFNERRHEPGSKMVLGQKIKEDGVNEGLEVLHMLATSPATAHFICEKLAVRFVSDTPPPALVDRMAASFLASKGDIKTVLRTMWSSPEFWSADAVRAKVKTPEEFVVSAVRASGVEVTNPAALVASEAKLGMPIYGMQTPNGYGWKAEDWVNTGALVSRMNFALVLSGGRIPGAQTEWAGELGIAAPGVVKAGYAPEDVAAKERRLEGLLLGDPVSERTRQTVLAQAENDAVTEQAEAQFDLKGGGGRYQGKGLAAGAKTAVDDPQAAVMAGLLLGSPEFQRR